MLTGLAFFLLLAAFGLAAEMKLIDRLRHTPLNDWLADHVYLPALRMPALIGFVLGAYPALYGLDAAPPLSGVLHFDWFGRALNILFILPLLFSLLPVAGRLMALVLPLQGIALTALLFAPLAAAHGVDAPSFAVTPGTWLTLFALAIAGHLLGSVLARRLPDRAATAPLYDAAILLFQAPVILTYGRALGAQLGTE